MSAPLAGNIRPADSFLSNWNVSTNGHQQRILIYRWFRVEQTNFFHNFVRVRQRIQSSESRDSQDAPNVTRHLKTAQIKKATMKYTLWLLLAMMISCKDKEEVEKPASKLELEKKASENAELELEDKGEKIALISAAKDYPLDSTYLILKDYYTKANEFDFNSGNYYDSIFNLISKNRKVSKKKVAQIIFAFKYEVLTREEIEQEFIDNYEPPKDYDNQPEPE
ncbi:MAG: hypothetical protein EOO99_11955 [Pedobacter sp.]|nr:MAG: hypothetical protein EOO99_11955 [Pedobacter sp.]